MNLYKFLHPDRIDVLRNKSIRFTQPNAFNDPFEFSPSFISFSKDSTFNEQFDDTVDMQIEDSLRKLPKEYRTDIVKSYLKKFLTANKQLIHHSLNNFAPIFADSLQKQANNSFGILSLTTEKDNLLMWSHYADSHNGFCIKFNTDSIFFNRRRSEFDELYHLRKITYKDIRPSGIFEEMSIDELFEVKSDIWEYENEWRMYLPLIDANNILDNSNMPIYLFNFPSNAISEIIIGAKASQDFINQITSIIQNNIEYNHVKLVHAKISNTHYKLDYVNVN